MLRLAAIPERRPQVPGAVIVLGNAGPQADALHQAVPADPFQLLGKPPAQIIEHFGILPDIGQAVFGGMAKNHFGNGLADAAQGIGSVI